MLVAKEAAWRAAELRRIAWWRRPLYWAWMQLLRVVGFGYRPALALVPALAIVCVGWLLVDWSYRGGVLVPAKPAAEAEAAAAPVQATLVPFAYSFEAFVPIVKLGQVEAFRPDMAQRWGYWLQVYLWVHGMLGWLIGGLAAAGILGVFRKE